MAPIDASAGLASLVARPYHRAFVAGRRARVLARRLSALLTPGKGTALDVGCGDGRLSSEIRRLRPALAVTGIDVRPSAAADRVFDGVRLPYPDRSFDAALLVDVLHHAERPAALLAECRRVSGGCVIVKDHVARSVWDKALLTFMDWGGNAGYGADPRASYFSPAQWGALFVEAGVRPVSFETDLRLYPWPQTLVCDRSLHFIAKLASG